MSKQSCIIYGDFEVQVRRLSDTQAARLFRAILSFCNSEVADLDDDPVLGMAWANILSRLQADRAKYMEKCAMNAEIGRLGGKASARSRADAASGRKRTVANGGGRKRTVANGTEWKLNYTETDTKKGDSAHDAQDADDSSNSASNPDHSGLPVGSSPKALNFKKWSPDNFIESVDLAIGENPALADHREPFLDYFLRNRTPGGKPRFQAEKAWNTAARLRNWASRAWNGKQASQPVGQCEIKPAASGPSIEEMQELKPWERGYKE